MKTLLRTTICLGLLLACSVSVQAQGFTVTISLDENGNGHFSNSAGFNQNLTGYLAPDPGPGGLASALTYDILNPPGLTSGDLFLTDPTTLLLSDVIRFNANEATQSGQGAVVFYSLSGGGLLADTGFPTANYTNTFSLVENVSGATSYTPLVGQPGFVTGAGGPVTYLLTSDAGGVSTVPDLGNAALLMAFAMAALIIFARMSRGRFATAAARG